MTPPPTMPSAVAEVFASYPPGMGEALRAIRALIFETAAQAGVGPLEESLKWGEPAYVPAAPRTGSPVRLGHRNGRCAVYFICTTDLLDQFRSLFVEALTFEGNRAILLDPVKPLPDPLAACLGLALTYHLRRRGRAPTGSAAR